MASVIPRLLLTTEHTALLVVRYVGVVNFHFNSFIVQGQSLLHSYGMEGEIRRTAGPADAFFGFSCSLAGETGRGRPCGLNHLMLSRVL